MVCTCLYGVSLSPTAPPEATSEIVPESSPTNSTSGTTRQERATVEGEFE